MRRVLTLVIAVLALLIAVSGAAGAGVATGDITAASAIAGGAGDATHSATADECEVGDGPELIGCWNGVHYAEDPGFNQSDGLTEAELERLTHLTMARVEHLRERPFQAEVPVETVTRSEFTNDTADGSDGGQEFQRWNDQVWKALFVVGEDDASGDAIDAVFGGAVSGFYSPADERVVLVVDEDETLQVSELTLAHEVGHAMQDQYHDLADSRYVGDTQDADLAVDGIVEGEVVYLEELYDERCEGDWTCLDEPDAGSGGELPDGFNFGILQTVLQPYSDGVPYVADLVDEEGWEAVNATMDEPPETTSEVIHQNPEYETREVEFEDNATGGWETYEDQGVDGAETAGEASMFVMFWYQSFEYDHPVLDPSAGVAENIRIHTQPDAELRTRAAYNYAHEATDGWAGDELYPYRNDAVDTDDIDDGYVWVTEWQTPADAARFHETYLRMLTAHGGDAHASGEVYAIDDGDFRGAYGVERENTTVTIAHAPEPAEVLDLRPESDLVLPSVDGTDETDDAIGGTDTEADDETDGSGDTSSGEAPGFGVIAALVGLIAAVSLLARRSRA